MNRNDAVLDNVDRVMMFVMTALSLLLITFAGCQVGETKERQRMMKEAVKNGHARFYVDNNAVLQFEWFPRCGGVSK